MSIYRNFVQDLEKSVTRKLVGKAAGFNYHLGFDSKTACIQDQIQSAYLNEAKTLNQLKLNLRKFAGNTILVSLIFNVK